MPDDRDDLTRDARGQSDIAGEPLTASIQDIVDEHADAARHAAEQQAVEEAEQRRMARRKADEERTALRHTRGARSLRPTRVVDVRRERDRDAAAASDQDTGAAGGEAPLDARWLLLAAVAGVVLAGGIRRVLMLGAIGAGAWALYRRVLEPARDPAAVLQ